MTKSNAGTGTAWKIAIGSLIGIFLIGTVASLVVASRNVSRVVDAEYYTHGLHYGQTCKVAHKDAGAPPGPGGERRNHAEKDGPLGDR